MCVMSGSAWGQEEIAASEMVALICISHFSYEESFNFFILLIQYPEYFIVHISVEAK